VKLDVTGSLLEQIEVTDTERTRII
jgi:hypothetical protein